MFVTEFRLERLGMDQRDEEEKHSSGELMKKQGFGMLRSMRTRSRCARVECDVAWRRVRLPSAYAWIAICQVTRTRDPCARIGART